MYRRPSTSLKLALVTLTLAVAPACSSSAGGLRQKFADRIAYRPTYPQPNPVPRTRALFLSGYAGAKYPTRNQTAPVYPTTYTPVPHHPLQAIAEDWHTAR